MFMHDGTGVLSYTQLFWHALVLGSWVKYGTIVLAVGTIIPNFAQLPRTSVCQKSWDK